MRYYSQDDMYGGKIHIGKPFKKVAKDIKKGFDKNIDNPLDKTFSKKNIGKAGKFMEKKVLPSAVSVGIPLASSAIGALGAMYGIPPELTAPLAENLMQEYIPKKYQSNNKYIGLLGDALNMGVSGDIDPYSMMKFQNDLTGAVSGDLGKFMGKNKISQQVPTSQYYNPDDPYNDLMLQLMTSYMTTPLPSSSKSSSQPVSTPNVDVNALSDAIYKNSNLGEGADSLTISVPPFQQREGSMSGLLGGGVKKKKSKPKKIIEEEVEIYVKKKPSYKKFSHAKNTALDQLLEAKAEKEEKKAKEAMKEMIEKQNRALTALGYGVGGKPKKGSQEAKDHMAKLRAMKKKK